MPPVYRFRNAVKVADISEIAASSAVSVSSPTTAPEIYPLKRKKDG